MKDRLAKIMEYYGKSAARFSEEIGIQRSSISHIISGRNQPSYEFILKILNKYPELNAEWLLKGEGQMIKETVNKKKDNKPNLFTNYEIKNQSESEEQKEINDNQENTEKKNRDKINVTNVNNIEKIVLFYENGIFIEYSPGK